MTVNAALAADLFEPYRFEFFRNGTVVAVAAGALCGLLGVFVVLRGMSYIGHGLSHAVFGGAAASAVMNFNYFIGAGIWGIASGVLIGRISRRRILGADAAIGVVTTASFAVGLALLNRYGQAKRSIEAVLFGSVLGVKIGDIVAVVVVGLIAVTIIVVGYRRFLFSTFDPEVASVSGVKVSVMEALLMVMLSLTILVTMRVIGTLLISALLVIPAATARMLTNRFARMLWVSPAIGAAGAFLGMNLAYHTNTSAAAMIIIVCATAFSGVYFASGVRGKRRVAALGHL